MKYDAPHHWVLLKPKKPGRPTSGRCSIARECAEPSKAGKQMAVALPLVYKDQGNKTGAPTNKSGSWYSINWKKAEGEVRRLQMRIAKMTEAGRHGTVKALQWLLTHSFYAKALAVRRVTSNRGKKTPGVDGVVWRYARAKMQAVRGLSQRCYRALPLRRIYIPKKKREKTSIEYTYYA